MGKQSIEHVAHIPMDGVTIEGIVTIPAKARAMVLIAHPSAEHRENLSSQYIMDRMHEAGFGTLAVDLLSPVEAGYPHAYFDISLLTQRIEKATFWLRAKPRVAYLPIGYFTEGTGTAAALFAAANLKPEIKALVSCGGRPELAFAALPCVDVPVLFIAGEEDDGVARINQRTANLLSGDFEVEILPGTKNLFDEPALEEVARLACRWFGRHLQTKRATKKVRRK